MTRKAFLSTLIAAFVCVPVAVKAAEPTAAEKANLDLVTRFCESFATGTPMRKVLKLMARCP